MCRCPHTQTQTHKQAHLITARHSGIPILTQTFDSPILQIMKNKNDGKSKDRKKPHGTIVFQMLNAHSSDQNPRAHRVCQTALPLTSITTRLRMKSWMYVQNHFIFLQLHWLAQPYFAEHSKSHKPPSANEKS